MVPEINYWAVVLAALSTLIIGSVWYTPAVFGKYWMRTAKVDPDGSSAVGSIIAAVLVSLVTAWVLAGATFIAWSFYGGSFFWNAVLTAAILWAGFTAARIITHDVFERRPYGLTILNIAHELVTLIVMAVIIGVWPPAGSV